MTTSVTLTREPTGSMPPETRVEGLAPQFKTVADQTTSYLALQAELTRLKQEKGLPAGDPDAGIEQTPPVVTDSLDVPPQPTADEAAKAAEDEAAKDAAKKGGVDLDTYQSEFNSTGDVKPESRDALAKSLEAVLGKDARTIVDQFIDGRKTSMSNEGNVIKDIAGGAEAYSTLVNWASKTMSPDEIAVYNQQVNSGNRTTATFAVEALRGRFERANGGREPSLFKGTFTPVQGNVEPFASAAQMTAAMKDPAYKKDQAYRDKVAARIAATTAF